jgi:hypothetical protein
VVDCIVFLYLKVFVFLIKYLLAIISKFGGRVDDSILWLSFAQQKHCGEKCPRYEFHSSYHDFNFPTAIFHGTVFSIWIVFGELIPWTLFPSILFTVHGLILHLDFRFLWTGRNWQTSASNSFLVKCILQWTKYLESDVCTCMHVRNNLVYMYVHRYYFMCFSG